MKKIESRIVTYFTLNKWHTLHTFQFPRRIILPFKIMTFHFSSHCEECWLCPKTPGRLVFVWGEHFVCALEGSVGVGDDGAVHSWKQCYKTDSDVDGSHSLLSLSCYSLWCTALQDTCKKPKLAPGSPSTIRYDLLFYCLSYFSPWFSSEEPFLHHAPLPALSSPQQRWVRLKDRNRPSIAQ